MVGLARNLAGVGLVALAEDDLRRPSRRWPTRSRCEEAGRGGGWLWTLAHVWLATIRLLRGSTGDAEPLLKLALAAAREREDPLAIYITLYTSAQVALARNDATAAREQLEEEGIRLSVRTGGLANLAYFLDTLGVVEGIDGEPRRVAVLHGAARRLRETVGSNVYGYYKPDESMLATALESARTALGPGFGDAVAEGRALPVSRVVDVALRTA